LKKIFRSLLFEARATKGNQVNINKDLAIDHIAALGVDYIEGSENPFKVTFYDAVVDPFFGATFEDSIYDLQQAQASAKLVSEMDPAHPIIKYLTGLGSESKEFTVHHAILLAHCNSMIQIEKAYKNDPHIDRAVQKLVGVRDFIFVRGLTDRLFFKIIPEVSDYDGLFNTTKITDHHMLVSSIN